MMKMGCDIHVHTEVKIAGKWEHYSAVPLPGRRYGLFAIMANVRNYDNIEPISEPRGLPEDCSSLTRFCSDYDGGDGHSHSWLSAEEIAEAVSRYASLAGAEGWKLEHDWEWRDFGFLFGNSWSGWVKYPTERPKGVEDIRWVFWFDN